MGVKNGTGLEMTYCIESDGGVNHTLLSASERARQAMRWDELLFEDMVEVEVVVCLLSLLISPLINLMG